MWPCSCLRNAYFHSFVASHFAVCTQVVIDQNVLTRASSELKMSEASAIADNTLEYTVRSLMWALHAPEVLKVTRGEGCWVVRLSRVAPAQAAQHLGLQKQVMVLASGFRNSL